MSGQPPEDGEGTGSEELGTVAEEAAKLFGALSDWAKDQAHQQGGEWAAGISGLAEHAATTAKQVHDHLGENIATGSAECRYCPVCRTIHVVRQMSPEVRAHLTTAATSLLQAAAGVMATQVPASAQRPGVERIDLDAEEPDDPDAWGVTSDDPETQL